MKNLVLLIAIMTIAGMGFAQNKQGLIGPAAKNYKPWLDDQKPAPTKVVTVDQEPLVGPAAKNGKSWSGERALTYSQVETLSPRPMIIGPKAKSTLPLKYMERNMAKVPRQPKGEKNLENKSGS